MFEFAWEKVEGQIGIEKKKETVSWKWAKKEKKRERKSRKNEEKEKNNEVEYDNVFSVCSLALSFEFYGLFEWDICMFYGVGVLLRVVLFRE